jgi:hypothetical protein
VIRRRKAARASDQLSVTDMRKLAGALDVPLALSLLELLIFTPSLLLPGLHSAAHRTSLAAPTRLRDQ